MRTPRPSSSITPSSIRLALAVAAVLLSTAVLAVRAPAPAAAASRTPTSPVTSQNPVSLPALPLAARGGGGFRSRPRISPNRPLSRNRPVARRNPNTGRALRSFSRTLLQALGIAFLLSLLFGIGPGGSPLGLLVLLGIIALVVVARRRRRQYGYN
jgi:hypothetical protein